MIMPAGARYKNATPNPRRLVPVPRVPYYVAGRLAQRLERPVYTRKVECSNHSLPTTSHDQKMRGRSSAG